MARFGHKQCGIYSVDPVLKGSLVKRQGLTSSEVLNLILLGLTLFSSQLRNSEANILRGTAMQRQEVEVFSGAINSVLLRTPGRRFPGLLIQGDTFASLYSLARQIRDLVPASSDREL